MQSALTGVIRQNQRARYKVCTRRDEYYCGLGIILSLLLCLNSCQQMGTQTVFLWLFLKFSSF